MHCEFVDSSELCLTLENQNSESNKALGFGPCGCW